MSGQRSLSASKLLLREWHSGELRIVLAALILAVAVVVGISAFVSALQATLEGESRRFLAADSVVSSRQMPPPDWRQRARDMGLSTAQLTGFPTMVMNEADAMYLASVKAVDENYPLRGTVLISDQPFSPPMVASGVPAPGEVWLAPRLFTLLDVEPGDMVWIGEAQLTVAGAIRGEPDGTAAMFGYGPRVLMNRYDLDATRVIQPGSRVTHRLLLRGDDQALAEFQRWVEPQLVQGQRLIDMNDDQPGVSRTLDRARAFLLLAGSLGVVLAAAAVALAARRFAQRHTANVAIMKSLGAPSTTISRLYASSLLLLGLAAAVTGSVLGLTLQSLFFSLFAEQLGDPQRWGGWRPLIMGSATAGVCLLFFAWPPLRRLGDVSPLRVLRREVDAHAAQRPIDFVLGSAALVALMWWYSLDLRLTLGLVSGLVVTIAVGYALARWLLRTGRVAGSAAGSFWRLALAGLLRRGNANALQTVIFAIAIMLMMVLVIVRTSLVSQWQSQLPEGTPNHFVLNIAPEMRDPLQSALTDMGLEAQPQYPMSRGRVMAVNGQPLAKESGDDSAPGRQREANFTHASTLPDATEVIDGAWWPPDTSDALVSLEQRFAESVGAGVGDVLTFRIGASEFIATVASIRSADWQSMKPNFFVIFPPSLLEPYPKMYLTSLYLPPEQKGQLNTLVRRFPTLTVIELDIVIAEIRAIVDQVSAAIEMILLVILVAGALVLIAGVQSSLDERVRESALLRALGARKRLLLGALWVEFAMLGLSAGILAIGGAEVASWMLQTRVLDMQYAASLWLWPIALLAAVLLLSTVGVLSCRRAVNTPPLVVLREV